MWIISQYLHDYISYIKFLFALIIFKIIVYIEICWLYHLSNFVLRCYRNWYFIYFLLHSVIVATMQTLNEHDNIQYIKLNLYYLWYYY